MAIPSRARPLLIVVALLLLLGLIQPTAPAASMVPSSVEAVEASRGDAPRWSAPQRIGTSRWALRAVTCASKRFCALLGPGSTRSRTGFYVLRPRSGWSLFADGGIFNLLYSVDCVTNGGGGVLCVGVGGKRTLTDDQTLVEPVLATFDGTSWTEVPVDIDRQAVFYSVSCASAEFCMISGSRGAIDGGYPNDLSTWALRSSVLSEATFVADGPTDDDGWYAEVSCSSSTFCGMTSHYPEGRAWVFDGTRWRASRVAAYHFADVSCPRDNFCLAVSNGYRYLYRDGRWKLRQIQAGAHFVAASCVSPRFCVVLDSRGAAYAGRPKTLGTRARLLPHTDVNAFEYRSASCVASDWCVVGARGSRVFTYR